MAPPEEWGPPTWYLIFTIINDMPEYPRNTEYYQMFFESLQGVLPCQMCRDHYTSHIELFPPPVWSREAMRKWATDLRNKIRMSKGKSKSWFN
jgi:hypothetical protein